MFPERLMDCVRVFAEEDEPGSSSSHPRLHPDVTQQVESSLTQTLGFVRTEDSRQSCAKQGLAQRAGVHGGNPQTPGQAAAGARPPCQ